MTDDNLDREAAERAFQNPRIRQASNRKVLIIVTFQLLITYALLAFSLCHKQTELWINQHLYCSWYVMGITITCVLALACLEKCRRTFPINYILMMVFTLGMSFLLPAHLTKIELHALALLLFVGSVLVVQVLFAMLGIYTKTDFTGLGAILFGGFPVIIIFCTVDIVNLFVDLYTFFGFMITLILDMQMMMGGNRMVIIKPEDYVFAAVLIYFDIVFINFVYK